MSVIVFYEKTGCRTNARQRRLLEEAGHTVVPRDLLAEKWTAPRLMAFFGDAPVVEWFNAAAPAVKSGAVVPAALDQGAALALMLANPLLIRRPLLEIEGRRHLGFTPSELAPWLGPTATADDPAFKGCAHHPDPDPTTAREQA
ncbi:ArsC/Spx/MgsR family protein [Nitrospirillum iridis]|uniref:Nitrogenase-associated protein n=1 Tax=Nitrospirillum iridis TaxID=765888 RepID=A0A7X0EF16_9PROT|nr:hypothetical protein [Nitrospirillum iridis]